VPLRSPTRQISGRKDDRKFQPLAGMDGEQLHAPRIAFDAQLAFVRSIGVAVVPSWRISVSQA
jgi:hypothetical protein